jgi:hypothetical protein
MSAFHCYNEMLELISSERGKVYLVQSFGGCSLWMVGPIAFGPVLRQ